MKIAGLVGGIGPESTMDYYRSLVAAWRARRPDGSYPRLLINSIDLALLLDLIGAGRLDECADYLAEEVERLARAGASFAALAANTPHVVFDAVAQRASIPLISLVEVARDAAQARGLGRVGLLGTRFTMAGRFYADVFTAGGIALVSPEPHEQAYIHDAYMGELVEGIFRPETRARFVAIGLRMQREEGIEGLVLGGTELPLLLRHADELSLPLLDTTQLHIDAIVTRLLS